MSNKVSLLDATLRDGGQGLDDLFNNGFSDKYYSEEVKYKIIDEFLTIELLKYIYAYQFSLVQSLSPVRLFATP